MKTYKHLGSIADIFSDGDWVESKDQDETGNVRLIQLADIGNGNFLNKSKRYMNIETAKRLNCTFLKKNDLLIARMPDPIGRCCLFPFDEKEKYITVVDIAILRPNDTCSRSYIRHILNSQYLRHVIEGQTTGTTRKRITRKKLEKLEVPLPPLAEQLKIAAILDAADSLKQKDQQLIEHYTALSQSLFLEMFGDPVRNPMGWENKELSEVTQSQLGKMLSKAAKRNITPKKYLRNANVRWRSFKLDDVLEMDFNDKEILKFSLENGDLLVCEGGDVGRCAIWRNNLEDCYFQKALHRVRSNKDALTPEYLQEYFFWMSKLGGLTASVSEVTFSHLTAEKLKRLKIPLPPIELQNQYAEHAEKIEEQKQQAQDNLEKSETLFSSLLQRAFKGELTKLNADTA